MSANDMTNPTFKTDPSGTKTIAKTGSLSVLQIFQTRKRDEIVTILRRIVFDHVVVFSYGYDLLDLICCCLSRAAKCCLMR